MAASATFQTRSRSVEADASQSAIAQHLGLVYHLARALMRSRGIAVELDELVSAGTLGLIDAVANFDSTRGLAFTTFATPRIRGAMLDELRRFDHVPRSVRRKARALHAANDALCAELGSLPDDTQMAARLGIDVATLWRWRADANTEAVPLADFDYEGVAAEAMFGMTGSEVDDALTREQELNALKDAIRTLGSRERAILSLYYYEELRLHQIAEVLGVSESRVSQIRTQAISRLRAQMARFRDEAGAPAQAAVSSSRRRASVSVGNLST